MYRTAVRCEALTDVASFILFEKPADRANAEGMERELATFPAMVEKPAPVSVIPTCANLDRFRPQGAPDAPFTLGYVGQFGTWYLLAELMRFFAALFPHRLEAHLLIVNRAEHAAIAHIPADRRPTLKLQLGPSHMYLSSDSDRRESGARLFDSFVVIGCGCS